MDFLSKYQFSIDVASKSVTILHSDDQHSLPPLQSIEYSTISFSGIIDLFPDLTSTLTSQKRHSCHHILEVEGPPVAFHPHRLSSERARALDTILDDLLERGIIRPSSSSWASPVHLVKKKNGSFWLVHDYRLLNTRTKKQNYPLPWISDLTHQIRGATVFSSLDLKHAFWRLDVRPSDRKYTGFCTSRGNFEYNKLPLGLTYASCSFQKFMNYIMRGTEAFFFCYIDDILVFSADEQEHKIHLIEVANRLNKCLLLETQHGQVLFWSERNHHTWLHSLC